MLYLFLGGTVMSKIDMIRQMRQKLLDITNAIESSKSSDLDYYAFQKIKAEEIPLEQMIKEQYSIESKIDKYLLIVVLFF